ncbi:MAG: hypothetical protein ABSF76_16005 [Opitutaceae bacterium]
MTAPRAPRNWIRILTSVLMLAAAPLGIAAESTIEGITAVSSKAFNGYTRTRLPDGSFKPETYAFGNGGFVTAGSAGAETPGAQRDATIDKLGFDSIAKALNEPLSGQNYVLTADPDATNLLIMVFWGTTVGGYHEKKGKFRDLLDLKNAALLGFDSEDLFGPGFGNNIRSNIQKQVHSQMLDALESNRYFLILRAFDFQASLKQKKIRLLWETRFSINQRHNAFDEALPLMAQYASQCFGQDSRGLMMARVSEGRVLMGDIKSLGEVSPPKN